MSVKYHHDIIQGTDDWHMKRLGIVTASNVNKLVTPAGNIVKGDKVRSYACAIAAQRELMHIEDSYQSFDMVRGHIQEDIAREIYNDTHSPVKECGIIINDDHGVIIGCSPDGIVGEDGGIEIKSRLAKFQFSTIIEDEVPNDYVNQIQASLIVSGRDWWDFVQYSNGMPLYVKRVYPDPGRQTTIIGAIVLFEAMVKKIQEEYAEKSKGLVKTERVDFMRDDEIKGDTTNG